MNKKEEDKLLSPDAIAFREAVAEGQKKFPPLMGARDIEVICNSQGGMRGQAQGTEPYTFR